MQWGREGVETVAWRRAGWLCFREKAKCQKRISRWPSGREAEYCFL